MCVRGAIVQGLPNVQCMGLAVIQLRPAGDRPGLATRPRESVGTCAACPRAGEEVAEIAHRKHVPAPEAAAPATRLVTFRVGAAQRATACDGGAHCPPAQLEATHSLEDVDSLVTVRAEDRRAALVNEGTEPCLAKLAHDAHPRHGLVKRPAKGGPILVDQRRAPAKRVLFPPFSLAPRQDAGGPRRSTLASSTAYRHTPGAGGALRSSASLDASHGALRGIGLESQPIDPPQNWSKTRRQSLRAWDSLGAAERYWIEAESAATDHSQLQTNLI